MKRRISPAFRIAFIWIVILGFLNIFLLSFSIKEQDTKDNLATALAQEQAQAIIEGTAGAEIYEDTLTSQATEYQETIAAQMLTFQATVTGEAIIHENELQTATYSTPTPSTCDQLVAQESRQPNSQCNLELLGMVINHGQIIKVGENFHQVWLLQPDESYQCPLSLEVSRISRVPLSSIPTGQQLERTFSNPTEKIFITPEKLGSPGTLTLDLRGKENEGTYYSCWQIHLKDIGPVLPLLPVIVEVKN